MISGKQDFRFLMKRVAERLYRRAGALFSVTHTAAYEMPTFCRERRFGCFNLL